MDPFDTTNVLYSKIKSIDPENASKIMGYLLIQDIQERDLMRFAYGSVNLLNSLIIKVKTHLGLSSNTLSAPLNPIPRPTQNTLIPFSQTSPRIDNNGFLDFAQNPSSPSNTWPHSASPNNGTNFSPKSSPFLSYDNIRAASLLIPVNGGGDSSGGGGDFIDEFQLNDYLSFLNDSSSKNEEFLDPRLQLTGYSLNNGDTHLHRRSLSASDACLGSEDGGFGVGYKPCHYFARGFCKNGESCKYVHGSFGDSVVDVNSGGIAVGSPGKMEDLYLQHEEMMRMKAAQQQRLAAQLMGGGVSPLTYNKNVNLLLQQQNELQRSAAAELMMEEFYKFGLCRSERNDILAMGFAEKANSAARQIYLTFPADSSFTDEDVSNYFGMFGPVQDVRIPYQQKRMFGFVTFVHPETVKLILARGNPHFICDSRVLVKPYKEKGKVPDKRQQHLQQPLEIGKFSPCSSPSGLDTREPYDLGANMFYNAPEMMFRRRLEEHADFQQAIELQRTRLMNLQLPNMKNEFIHHHQRSSSVGSSVLLPTSTHINRDVHSPEGINQKFIEGNIDTFAANVPSTVTAKQQLLQEVTAVCPQNHDNGNGKGLSSNSEAFDHYESLLASPMKPAEDHLCDVSTLAEVNESTAFSASSPSENNATLPMVAPSSVVSH
ncbi:zf-CCCH domain-containing protein/RRM_6 domain-containing protein, partial [Cephalotus follicularis]